MIEYIGLPGKDSNRPFCDATRAGGLIFVSGRTAPHDPETGVFRGHTAAEQVGQALALIDSVLKSAGSNLQHIVQMTMLISEPSDYDECNAAYLKWFPNELPARHTVRFGVPTSAKVGFACIAIPCASADLTADDS